MPATVPGTVLTTMIDRGIYPDPDYGLNNLAVPESLNRQDYWYRSDFTGPKLLKDGRLSLIFEGINYQAEVWLNGHDLGAVKGAFIRGVFDVTGILKPGAPNDVSLLPGEFADVIITAPQKQVHGAAKIALRGWNVTPATI